MNDQHPHPARTIAYAPERVPNDETLARLRADHATAETRRTVRHFSPDPVPRDAIETALRIAGTAPSGAHRPPWFFVAISDPETKRRIREAAEVEERDFYERRAPPDWLEALARPSPNAARLATFGSANAGFQGARGVLLDAA